MTKTFGPDHQITLVMQHYIAHTLSEQGKYEDALTLYKEVLKRMTETLGPDHACSLETENALSITLLKQCKYDEA